MNFSETAIERISMALALSPEEIPNYTEVLDDTPEKLLYCWRPGREGMHLITDYEGNLLLAVGSFPVEKLLEEYNKGTRTHF